MSLMCVTKATQGCPQSVDNKVWTQQEGPKSMSKDFKNLTWGTPKDKFITFFSPNTNWTSLKCVTIASQGGSKSVKNKGRTQQERSEKYVKRFRKFDLGYTQR